MDAEGHELFEKWLKREGRAAVKQIQNVLAAECQQTTMQRAKQSQVRTQSNGKDPARKKALGTQPHKVQNYNLVASRKTNAQCAMGTTPTEIKGAGRSRQARDSRTAQTDT